MSPLASSLSHRLENKRLEATLEPIDAEAGRAPPALNYPPTSRLLRERGIAISGGLLVIAA